MSTLLESPEAPVALSAAAPVVDRLHSAVTACVTLLQDTAIEDRTEAGAEVTWPTWVLTDSGVPERCTGGRASLYGGDAGIAWALRRLGVALGRADVTTLGAHAAAALRRRRALPELGLLSGRIGVDLAGGSDVELPWTRDVSALTALSCSDLTSGLAGALLALTRLPEAAPETAAALVDMLWQRSERQVWGRGWPDPTQHGDDARPLCGMAHGASGIAWSLAECAWRWPRLADSALSLAHEALRFEAAWSDPLHGGWPDLRGSEPVWAARWCHGAAGAGAIRLRLLELSARGLDAPWQEETIRAELEVAVQACGGEVWQEREIWQAYGAAALGQGWTLCHGVGAPVAVLDLAATALHEPAHRELALDTAADFLDIAGDDPGDWPCGTAVDGDLGLFNGIAGAALLLADLAGISGRDGPAVLLG